LGVKGRVELRAARLGDKNQDLERNKLEVR